MAHLFTIKYSLLFQIDNKSILPVLLIVMTQLP